MIVIFKDESGKARVRPAFIGFIKNNFLRRLLCGLSSPFVVALTIVINLLVVAIAFTGATFRAIYTPLTSWKPIWKTEIWNRPRTKANPSEDLG